MNKIIIIAAIFGLLAISYTYCDGDSRTQKALESVKSAANKGAQAISNVADGISERVEQLKNPAPHIPNQHSIVQSAIYGTGRLIRNVTLETNNFVRTVASAGMDLGRKVPAAVLTSVEEVVQRIKPKGKNKENVQSGSNKGGSDSSKSVSQDAATSANAAAPEELLRKQ